MKFFFFFFYTIYIIYICIYLYFLFFCYPNGMIILNTAFIFLPIFTLFDFCFQKNYGLSFLTILSDHRLKLFNVYWCVCVFVCWSVCFFSCKNYVYYNYNYKFTILGFFLSFLFNRNRFYRILVDRKHSTLLFQLAVFLKPNKFFNLLFSLIIVCYLIYMIIYIYNVTVFLC